MYKNWSEEEKDQFNEAVIEYIRNPNGSGTFEYDLSKLPRGHPATSLSPRDLKRCADDLADKVLEDISPLVDEATKKVMRESHDPNQN